MCLKRLGRYDDSGAGPCSLGHCGEFVTCQGLPLTEVRQACKCVLTLVDALTKMPLVDCREDCHTIALSSLLCVRGWGGGGGEVGACVRAWTPCKNNFLCHIQPLFVISTREFWRVPVCRVPEY